MEQILRFEIDQSHLVEIFEGSIVDTGAEVLVSSDDNYLSAGGGVSRAIALAAGPNVKRERENQARNRTIGLGDVVRTSGGLIQCKYIYHGITLDFNKGTRADEGSLQKLVQNIISLAIKDDVRSLAIPALATGAAGFDMEKAAGIIFDELLRLVSGTRIERISIALLDPDIHRPFYDQFFQTRMAAKYPMMALRRRAEGPNPAQKGGSPKVHPTGRATQEDVKVLQYPNLVDEFKLASVSRAEPRLVEGLADVIIEQAGEALVEDELLAGPECHGFKGSTKHKLMEFLYLGEENWHKALGQALFRSTDLKEMAKKLGADTSLCRNTTEVVDSILRALCLNPRELPRGIGAPIEIIENQIRALRNAPSHGKESLEAIFNNALLTAGNALEYVLKDLLILYSELFFGPGWFGELEKAQILNPDQINRKVGGLRLTAGAAKQALWRLDKLTRTNLEMAKKLELIGRPQGALFPRSFKKKCASDTLGTKKNSDALPSKSNEHHSEAVLDMVISMRNDKMHARSHKARATDVSEIILALENLCDFFGACHREKYYPDVFLYDGTYEDRHGERFVFFIDEKGDKRKVRTDESVDPRKHYYCFYKNNPLHLFPVLIAKSNH